MTAAPFQHLGSELDHWCADNGCSFGSHVQFEDDWCEAVVWRADGTMLTGCGTTWREVIDALDLKLAANKRRRRERGPKLELVHGGGK